MLCGCLHHHEKVRSTLDAASDDLRVERVRVRVPADKRLERFFGRFGFLETGRSPGWIQTGTESGMDRVLIDEVLMVALL